MQLLDIFLGAAKEFFWVVLGGCLDVAWELLMVAIILLR